MLAAPSVVPPSSPELHGKAEAALRAGSFRSAEALYLSALAALGTAHTVDEVMLWNELGEVCPIWRAWKPGRDIESANNV